MWNKSHISGIKAACQLEMDFNWFQICWLSVLLAFRTPSPALCGVKVILFVQRLYKAARVQPRNKGECITKLELYSVKVSCFGLFCFCTLHSFKFRIIT